MGTSPNLTFDPGSGRANDVLHLESCCVTGSVAVVCNGNILADCADPLEFERITT